MNSALSVRRWAVIVAAALVGILAFVSMLVDPVPDADGRELLRGYADNPTLQGIHTNLLHYGFALMAPVAYAMVGMVRGRGAWLANVAAVFAVLGLSTLPGLVVIDFVGVAAVQEVGLDSAEAINERVDTFMWFIVLVAPAAISALIAVPLATIAMWRARLFPLWVPLVVTATTISVQAVPGGRLSFGIFMVGMLVLAWALWRVPVARWYGGAPETTTTVAEPAAA